MRCLGLLVLAVARAEDPAHKAARERQERFKTVEAKLKQVSHVRKGSQSAQFSEPSAGTTDIPAEDMTLEARIRVILDGKKARVEDGRPTFYFPSGKLLQRRRLSDPANGQWALKTYVGVAGTGLFADDGIFHYGLEVRMVAITDGASNTLMIGERPPGPQGYGGGWYTRQGCTCPSNAI
ncbi:MAG: DUF1559 domain-containing protein, partial [Gemmataceae bacterium]|nr:DUF1559 domain-containing protein [Gemmataceae bacterium]